MSVSAEPPVSQWSTALLSALLAVCVAACSSNNDRSADNGSAVGEPRQPSVDTIFAEALDGAHRSAENRSRDAFRRPRETLKFFGWQPHHTVVEVWPGGGWYTEVLAPLTAPAGVYFAAGFGATGDDMPPWRADLHKRLADKLAERPDVYGHVVLTELWPPSRVTSAPPGTADLVLVFRNVHSMLRLGIEQETFVALARMLKPGGVFGVVQHRGDDDISLEEMRDTGYVSEQLVIGLAKNAGLELEERSELNANPDDTRDHPAGVWTLPPSLRHCQQMDDADEKSACENLYRGIGESDRMTLRFRKPA